MLALARPAGHQMSSLSQRAHAPTNAVECRRQGHQPLPEPLVLGERARRGDVAMAPVLARDVSNLGRRREVELRRRPGLPRL
eukprot:771599-Prymnesium_polylepis.1